MCILQQILEAVERKRRAREEQLLREKQEKQPLPTAQISPKTPPIAVAVVAQPKPSVKEDPVVGWQRETLRNHHSLCFC